MKAAICYYSHHHGNTLKVVRAMAQGRDDPGDCRRPAPLNGALRRALARALKGCRGKWMDRCNPATYMV